MVALELAGPYATHLHYKLFINYMKVPWYERPQTTTNSIPISNHGKWENCRYMTESEQVINSLYCERHGQHLASVQQRHQHDSIPS